MALNPTVSVHIVTYNSELDIEECLLSVFRQTYGVQQIIVVDNHSEDQTKQIIQMMEGAHITLVENTENVGFAAAHNQAFYCSDTDLCLILNPDVSLDPDYVMVLVNGFQMNDELGSACGQILRKSNMNIVDSTGLVINKARRTFDRGSGEPAANWIQDSRVFGVSGAAAVYRRKMVDDISVNGQFFDESYFAYKEDVDVAWRARLYGWESNYFHRARAYHERGWKANSRKGIFLTIRKHSYINRYMTMLKNESAAYFIRHLPYILIFEILSNGYLLLFETKICLSWIDLIKNISQILNKRKVIQENKQVEYQQVYSWFMT